MVDLVKTTFSEWQEDKAARLAAALAYYTAFSLGPLLLIAISVAGLVFGREAAQGQVVAQMQGLLGEEGAQVIQTAIENASQPSASIVSTLIGLGLLLLGAAGLFGQLQDALNTIWEVQPKPGRGFMGMVKDRFLSFTAVLGTGFLLLVSLVISAGLTAVNTWMADRLPGGALLWQVINQVVSVAVVTLLFALIFKVLPDAEISWRDVWLGAFVTAVLFTIGKYALGLYLGRASVGSAYGAAGSLLVVLVWVYYSAQILFMGAEFTQVYANRFGSRIRPSPDAEAVTEEARAQQGMPHQDKDNETDRDKTKPAAGAAGTAGAASSPADSRLGVVRGGALAMAAVLAVRGLLSGQRRPSPPTDPQRD
jgi:membrane protein